MEQDLQKSIYLLDCIWEIFVMVGKEARSDKQAIRFALDIGMVCYYYVRGDLLLTLA